MEYAAIIGDWVVMKHLGLGFFAVAAVLIGAPPAAAQNIGTPPPENETASGLSQQAQQSDRTGSAGQPGGRPQSVFDGDFITLGMGAGYRPDYQGSDDYRATPLPLIFGSAGGFEFGARGPGLYVDLIRDPKVPVKTSYVFGPSFRIRTDRNGKIKDDAVAALGKRKVAVELGINAAIEFSGVLNRADTLSLGIEALRDVAGAHKGASIAPSVSYSTPLSKAAFVNLSVSSQFSDDRFNRYYFSIDAAGAAASGLPVFAAKGGLNSVGAALVGGYDVSGNALDGG